MLKVWVLWVFFQTPWNFGPIPMSPGWWSATVTHSYEECVQLIELMNDGRDSARLAECLPAAALQPDPALMERDGDDV